MNIQEITLLTSNEYERLRPYINDLECTWWLKDEGEDGDQYCVSFLDADVTDVPSRDSERYVRPALRLTDIQNNKPGDKIAVFAYTWTVLEIIDGVTLAICDQIVTRRVFDKTKQSWDASELKQWLEAWLKKRNATEDNRRHKRYKCMNDIGLKYLDSPFLRYWAAPMALLLPIAIAICLCAWSVNDVLAMPIWLCTMVKGITIGVATINVLLTVFVLMSPHPDTGFRLLLNVIAMLASLVVLWNANDLFMITCLSSVLAITTLNKEYLGKIKYYS